MKIEIRHRLSGSVIKTVRAKNLRNSDLLGANLRNADFCGADLRNADLRGSNLRNADFCGADLLGADLRNANLRNANLRNADLILVDLRGADLRGSNLRNANLLGANLLGANLLGAKNAPLIINGLRWSVHISGTGWMQIGCEQHTISEWDGFDDERINSMHSDALSFWKANKDMLLGLCRQYVHEDRD